MSKWTLIAVGDLCGSRSLEANPFDQEIKNLIQGSSISIGNLEAPLDPNSKPMTKSGPSIAMNESQLDAVLTSGIVGYSLANNHMMDYGLQGLMATKNYLSSRNLISFGADVSECGAYEPTFYSIDSGITIALIGISEREFGAAENENGGVAILSTPLFLEAIKKANNLSDVLIVSVHGGIELSFLPPPIWRKALREMIDLGVDIVLGHHPHVIQGIENYKDGFIAYSLGDFWWPGSGENKIGKRSIGLLIEFTFDAKKIKEIILHPVFLRKDYKVKFIKGKELRRVVDFIHRLSSIYSRPSYDKLWLEYASHLYQERYAGRIFGIGAINNNMKDFLRYISVGFLGFLEKFFKIKLNTLEQQKLFFLNIIRNPSQRNICEIGICNETSFSSHLPERIKQLEIEFSSICSSISEDNS